jgi:phosphatidate cytidylyltransferase
MLRWRITLGVLIVAALIGFCWLDARSSVPGLWLMPLAFLIAVLGSQELIAMMRKRGLEPQAGLIYTVNVLMVVANAVYPVIWAWNTGSVRALSTLEGVIETISGDFSEGGLAMVVYVVGTLVAFIDVIRRYTAPGRNTEQLAVSVLAMTYIGVLLTFVVQLRIGRPGFWGLLPLLSLVAVVKMCDIGAYTVGRLIGRHKMTPILSPGKTWEGVVGGVVCGCFASWLMLTVIGPRIAPDTAPSLSPNVWMPYGMMISIVGIFGDLAESLLKRDLGVKDSSTWMPGFGGVLDILDSILFAAPVAYVCWTLFPIG